MPKQRQLISIRNKEDVWEHIMVTEEIFLYIRQLESYINYPESSNLLLRYNERFERANQRKRNEN